MNLTQELRKAPLKPGLYSICGPQGAGKTSLACGLLSTDYKYHNKWRVGQGKALARQYYEANGIKLHIADHLYFSNPKILLDKRRGIYTHNIDLKFLGLPNDDYEVQYLPRGSVVFVHEADILAYSHNWHKLSDYLRDLVKFCRHNLITIIFDMQYGGALAKALRDLTVGMFFIVDSGIKRFLLFWKRQVWKFLYVQTQLNNAVKEISQLGVDIKIPVVEWGKFHVRGNVFDRYNSFSAVPYFLRGIEKVGYVYRKHSEDDFTIKGIEQYCAAHPLEHAKEEEPEQEKPKKRSSIPKELKNRLNGF